MLFYVEKKHTSTIIQGMFTHPLTKDERTGFTSFLQGCLSCIEWVGLQDKYTYVSYHCLDFFSCGRINSTGSISSISDLVTVKLTKLKTVYFSKYKGSLWTHNVVVGEMFCECLKCGTSISMHVVRVESSMYVLGITQYVIYLEILDRVYVNVCKYNLLNLSIKCGKITQ